MEYSIHLKQFDGPLDLLLHLIEQAEVDIKDIFISEITSQYLEYMNGLPELDMDKASEFLTMAATLVYIKSRSLLPRPPKEDEDGEDPEEQLIRQLREYKAFKQAGEKLNQLREEAAKVFTRLPEEFLLPPREISLAEASVDELCIAFFEALRRGEAAEAARIDVHEVTADRFTIRAQLSRIREKLRERQTIAFEELFDEFAGKLEMIVTFMAILDMIMRNEIEVKQNRPFAPIKIKAACLIEDDEGIEYMDE